MNHFEKFMEIRNTDRIHNAIEKLKHNEDVSFVFLGGSISAGFQIKDQQYIFPNRLGYSLMEEYQNKKVHINNLAFPGIPSIFGLYQSVQHTSFYKPDVVFIEFAINDMKNREHQIAFESMMKACLDLPSKPAIVLLLAKSKVGYTCQNYMDMVAEHYHQSSIFISHAIDFLLESDPNETWEKYSDDSSHPNTNGHKLIWSLIDDFFKIVANTPIISEPIPDEPFASNELKNFKFVNRSWIHKNVPGNRKIDTFECSFTCKYIYLLYMLSPDNHFGDVEVIVDGSKLTVISGFRINSWEHPFGQIIELDEKAEQHDIKFRMQKGEEHKLFTLLNIGYC